MFDRSLRAKTVVGIGVATATLAVTAPLAAADPAPLFIPHAQRGSPRPGEGLSGADRSWLSLREATPRLGEALTGADRSWLPSRLPETHVAAPSNGFDWIDAGIGAGTAAAILLIAGGTAVAIRRRPTPAH